MNILTANSEDNPAKKQDVVASLFIQMDAEIPTLQPILNAFGISKPQ